MSAAVIDLRSDTVTRPTPAMRRAMAEAEVGDDVLGDDPTVISLEQKVAALLGKEAACFVPSGTMANQAAIRAQTEPGDEIICDEGSHIYNYEGGAPAVLSGCSLRFARSRRGVFDPDEMESLIRPSDPHSPRSRLVVIENTHNRGGGAVWPVEAVNAVADRARARGLRTHLDGARVWNACAAASTSPDRYAAACDSVSVCFSKGLGAPVGSAVVSDAGTIARVRRVRKMVGGGMRQAGILAAAAIYALDHHVARLPEDHAHARRLAEGLAVLPGIRVDLPSVETNMVYFDLEAPLTPAAEFCRRAREAGVWMLPIGPSRIRAVTHLDVTGAMIDEAVGRISGMLTQTKS